MEAPSRVWWIAHVFLWIVSGLACYVLWKDRNPVAARKHLVHSLWIGIVVPVIAGVLMVVVMLAFDVPVDENPLVF